jgi:LysM repeat protein
VYLCIKKQMNKYALWTYTVIAICSFSSVFSQADKKISRQEYIALYKDIAIKEMKRTGVPASITLAQGTLESGDGNSRLAKKANNHFGIKCHDWKGKKIRHDDDENNECFRKYKSAYDSYRDHSDFLVSKQRYASLFALEPTDYKGWAEGLKKAGYATSKNYDKALIKIIEENGLYAYDQGIEIAKEPGVQTALLDKSDIISASRMIFEKNRIRYIITKPGDTYASISKELDLLPWELKKYNELDEGSKIDSGQVLYVQPKRKKAEAGKNIHVVREGETMYDISQLYGIRLDELYRKNLMEEGTEPAVSQTLQLRKGLKSDELPPELVLKEEKDEGAKIEGKNVQPKDKEVKTGSDNVKQKVKEDKKDRDNIKQKTKEESETEFEFDFDQE